MGNISVCNFPISARSIQVTSDGLANQHPVRGAEGLSYDLTWRKPGIWTGAWR